MLLCTKRTQTSFNAINQMLLRNTPGEDGIPTSSTVPLALTQTLAQTELPPSPLCAVELYLYRRPSRAAASAATPPVPP